MDWIQKVFLDECDFWLSLCNIVNSFIIIFVAPGKFMTSAVMLRENVSPFF